MTGCLTLTIELDKTALKKSSNLLNIDDIEYIDVFGVGIY